MLKNRALKPSGVTTEKSEKLKMAGNEIGPVRGFSHDGAGMMLVQFF